MSAVDVGSPRRALRLEAAGAVLAREGLPLILFLAVLLFLLVGLPFQLQQDSWLTLVAGRAVSGGLPHHDSWTVWAQGREWVDQQWLAQLVFYGLARVDLKLALLLHALATASAFGLALFGARRLGGGPRAVTLVGVIALAATLTSWQLRAQSLALPLFVLVAYLLLQDARRPSPRVLLTLPLLALWANLHGSVILGIALVVLRGLCLLTASRTAGRTGERKRGLVLALLAPLLLLASPYAPELPGYYRHFLFGSDLSRFVVEWRHSYPSALSAGFYLLALIFAWTLARRRLPLFDSLALALLFVAGADALRNMAWFALLALLVLPRAVPLPEAKEHSPRMGWVPAALAATVLVAAVLVLTRPLGLERAGYRAAAAEAAAKAAEDHQAPVFADLRDADWLLWLEPSLRGRLAYDARLELLKGPELERLVVWYHRRGDWRPLAGRQAVIVVSEPKLKGSTRSYLAHGATLVYRDRQTAVFLYRR